MAGSQADIQEHLRRQMAKDVREEQQAVARALAGGSGRRPAQRARPPRIDVKEALKAEIAAPESGRGGGAGHFETSRPDPGAVVGISDQYAVLDSWAKVDMSRTHRGEFQFNFMVQGVSGDQVIGVKDRLDTIVEIRIGEFCVPLLPPDDFDPARLGALTPGLAALGLAANAPAAAGDDVTSPQSQMPFCSRVTMFLKEIGLQSFSDVDDRRHHFELNAAVSEAGDRIELKPFRDFNNYQFTDPIQDVHGLTVCFYNPGNALRFPPDCLYGAGVRADAGSLLEFAYTDEHNLLNLAVGDRINVRGFKAFDAASGNDYQTLNTYVSRPEGHQVGAAGYNLYGPPPLAAPPADLPQKGTTVVFRLNPDISTAGLSPPVAASTSLSMRGEVVICIAKNRVRIPIRFRRIVQRLTNYSAPLAK